MSNVNEALLKNFKALLNELKIKNLNTKESMKNFVKYLNVTHLTILDRIILTELFISFSLRLNSNLPYNPDPAFREYFIKAQHFLLFVQNNLFWVEKIFSLINHIVLKHNKKFKINFWINDVSLLSTWYLCCVLRGIFDNLSTTALPDEKKLIIKSQFTREGFVKTTRRVWRWILFTQGKLKDETWKKTIRMLMLLEFEGVLLKIVNKTTNDNKMKTHVIFEIKDELKSIHSTSTKMNLDIYLESPKFLDYPQMDRHNNKLVVGYTYTDTFDAIKKNKQQHETNKINTFSIEKLSNQSVEFSCSIWNEIKPVLMKSYINHVGQFIQHVFAPTKENLTFFDLNELLNRELDRRKKLKIITWEKAVKLSNDEELQLYLEAFRLLKNNLIPLKSLYNLALQKNNKDFPLPDRLEWDILKKFKHSNVINEMMVDSINKIYSVFVRFWSEILPPKNRKIKTEELVLKQLVFDKEKLYLVKQVNRLFSDSFQLDKIIVDIQANIQRWNYVYAVEKLLELQNNKLMSGPFYFAHFMDFRGRIYSTSPLHPLHNKLCRIYLKFNFEKPVLDMYSKTNLTKILNSQYFAKLIYYTYIISDETRFGALLNAKYLDPQVKQLNLFILIFLLLKTGYLEKTQLLKNERSYKLPAELLIKHGWGLINDLLLEVDCKNLTDYSYLCIINAKATTNLSFEDKLQLIYYMNQLQKAVKLGFWDNFIVNLDATGSAFQCWAFTNPVISNLAMKILNLSGSEWCDIYTWVINVFINTKAANLNNIAEVAHTFTRDKLKRSIMTVNYNVTEWRSLEYFLSAIDETSDLISSKAIDRSTVVDLHHLFFIYLTEDVFRLLYTHSLKDWTTHHLKNEYFILDDGTKLNLNYYRYLGSTQETAIKCDDIRWKFHHRKLSVDIDESGTAKALPANTIQAIDAYILRSIVDELNVLTIHDCIMISIADVPILIDNINSLYKKLLKKSNKLDLSYALFPFV